MNNINFNVNLIKNAAHHVTRRVIQKKTALFVR